jgi:hypothetical protein
MRPDASAVGAKELSPALQRWVNGKTDLSAVGTAEQGIDKRVLCRPYGTRVLHSHLPSAQPPQPAQKRRGLGTPVRAGLSFFVPQSGTRSSALATHTAISTSGSRRGGRRNTCALRHRQASPATRWPGYLPARILRKYSYLPSTFVILTKASLALS